MRQTEILRKIFFVGAAILIAGAGIFFGLTTCRGDQTMNGYLMYASRHPELNFTFKHPPDWKPAESQGKREHYTAVDVVGPWNKEDSYSVGFSITNRSAEGKDPGELLSEYLKTSSRFSQFKTIAAKNISIDKAKIMSSTYEYVMRLPLRKLNSKDVLMRGETFFVVRDGKSYRFTFTGTAKQFDRYLPVFKQMIKTFQFVKPETVPNP